MSQGNYLISKICHEFFNINNLYQFLEGRVKEVIVDSRINKILAMRTDSVAMLEALDAISEFYGANTVDARRSLRQGFNLILL